MGNGALVHKSVKEVQTSLLVVYASPYFEFIQHHNKNCDNRNGQVKYFDNLIRHIILA